MAYSFVAASSQYLELATPPVTGYPFSVVVRFRHAGAASTRTIFALARAGTNDTFQVRLNASNQIEAITTAGATSAAATSGIVSSNTAFGLVAVFASATSRLLYDGVNTFTNTTSVAPAAMDICNIGARYFGGVLGNFYNDDIGEIAVWNRVLTQDEANSLNATSAPPSALLSGLVMWLPMLSTANDMMARRAFTVNGGATLIETVRQKRAPRRR